MNSTWSDMFIWGYILAFVVFGFWGICWLRDWMRYQRKREQMIKEARRR